MVGVGGLEGGAPSGQGGRPMNGPGDREDRVGGILKVCCLNVKGCNKEEKREEIGIMFKDEGIDVLAVCETKLKGKGWVQFGDSKGLMSGVNERVRAKEGVGLIMKNELWKLVYESRCVSSRILWVKVKIGNEKWVLVSVYGPGSERSREERLEFWESLDRVLQGFGLDQKVCMLGDMNAKVGDREVRGVVGSCGVDGRNENGESLIELCLGRGLKIMNTYFRKRRDNKLTWMSEINGEGALIDYVCVSGRECARVVDVTVRRRAGGGLSDHYLVMGKVKIKKGWRRVERKE